VQQSITTNTLFYGNNLAIIREYIPDESVDLVYLDPPFNSNRNYNVLFKDEAVRNRKHRLKLLKISGIGAMLLRKHTIRAN